MPSHVSPLHSGTGERGRRVGARCARILARTGVVAACLLANVAPARAQLEVSDLELQLHPVGPGPVTAMLLVSNPGSAAATAQLHFGDWDRLEDGTNRFLPLGTLPGTCGARLGVFPASLSLAPGASEAVRVTWTPDSTAAAPSECWSILFVEQPPPSAAATGLALRVRTGVKVYVTPPGLRRSAAIEGVAVLPGAVPAGPRRVRFAVRNDGAVHLEAAARLEIRRTDDSVVDSLALPTLYALPGAVASKDAVLPALAPGHYVLLLFVDYGAPDLLAGQLELEIAG